MKLESGQLVEMIQSKWESKDPVVRLEALGHIEKAANDGLLLPQAPIVSILRAAMYEDFRPYPREIWIEGLAIADKVCDAYGWDFALFSPLVEE